MCLHSVSLNTKKTRNGFIGIGYKALINKPFKNTIGKWQRAKRVYGQNEYANDYTEYYPGFHIFLNIHDAIEYNPGCRDYIVEVSFKEIICFGTNAVYGNWENSKGGIFKPCVIANWMKINKIIQQ